MESFENYSKNEVPNDFGCRHYESAKDFLTMKNVGAPRN